MEIVIKTAAVTPPTTPLLSVQVQLLSVDLENSSEVNTLKSWKIPLYQVRTLTVGFFRGPKVVPFDVSTCPLSGSVRGPQLMALTTSNHIPHIIELYKHVPFHLPRQEELSGDHIPSAPHITTCW